MPKRRQAMVWTNADVIYWRKYAALGGDVLTEVFFVILILIQLFCSWVMAITSRKISTINNTEIDIYGRCQCCWRLHAIKALPIFVRSHTNYTTILLPSNIAIYHRTSRFETGLTNGSNYRLYIMDGSVASVLKCHYMLFKYIFSKKILWMNYE